MAVSVDPTLRELDGQQVPLTEKLRLVTQMLTGILTTEGEIEAMRPATKRTIIDTPTIAGAATGNLGTISSRYYRRLAVVLAIGANPTSFDLDLLHDAGNPIVDESGTTIWHSAGLAGLAYYFNGVISAGGENLSLMMTNNDGIVAITGVNGVLIEYDPVR